MENTIISGNKRTFVATLFSVAMMMLGGAALAATAPVVAPLKFLYKATDAAGKEVFLENKISTGYEANRIVVDKNGNVYITDAVMNTVKMFNTNGRLVKEFNVNVPVAIGVDDSRGLVYVSGAINEVSSIFILDNNNNDKDDSGNLAAGWGWPTTITVSTAGDVYVADSLLSIVRRFDAQGAARDYGPFGGERYASENFTDIYGQTAAFSRTRHRMTSLKGVAVDETNGLLYIGAKEVVELLSTTCQSYTSTDTSAGGGSGSDTNCSNDTEESWKYYNDVLGVPTDPTYKYWNLVNVTYYLDAVRHQVLVLDINTGAVKSRIAIGNGSGSAYSPAGLALDGKGRLYVATVGGSSTGGGGQLKVYNLDASPAAELTVSGFATGAYSDVAFSPDINNGAPMGRLFATMGDNKTVSSYSIDSGTNPANTAPTKPELLEPVSSNTAVAAVNTSTPTLRIKNSADAENDPLTYGYEICSGSCAVAANKVTSAGGITGGANNATSITISQELSDSLYHWRTQSFDGELTVWSDEATFCVDMDNSNPTKPDVIAPKGEIVSSFASSLSWSASTDSDCTNDIITYEVLVSDSRGNVVKSFSGVGSTSVKVSDISGLVNGGSYSWTVRAADNKDGKSDYSSGSFIYATTSVKLDSDQTGTNVYIDGNYGYYGKLLGTVPVEKSDIIPGPHFVTFIKEGYEPHYSMINVTDPAADLANSYVSYSAAMVAAFRIKLPAAPVALNINLDGGSAAPFVINYDYDKDGLKDIVAGGKVNVYDDNGEVIDVIDGRVYLYISEKQVDGAAKLVSKGALQADGSDIDVVSRAVPFMVDYDDDGNQDMLVGSGDGGIYLYRGTKNGFVSGGILALKDGNGSDLKGIVFNVAPVVVDYNNDGKKDLVVGSSDGTLRLYLNTGSDESPEFGAPVSIKADGSDLNVGSDSKAFFTDWNSDSKKDLVVGDGSGKISLFFNVGADDVPEFKGITGLQDWIKAKKKERGNKEYIKYLGYTQDLGDLTGGKFEGSPFVVDWDGTSARDIIVGNGAGGVAAYITE